MTDPASPLERFRASMIIDYEKWHDGIGYDLDALTAAGPEERDAIERLLLEQGVRGWRDVEALARFETPAARAALNAAAKQGDAETRMAVARYAPDLLAKDARAASLVRAIRAARPFEGLSAVVDEAEAFHPPEVIDALLIAALRGDGEAAVHFAALLLYLRGKAEGAFDWSRRPFFLRFNTDDENEREAAFRELCAEIGRDADALIGSGD